MTLIPVVEVVGHHQIDFKFRIQTAILRDTILAYEPKGLRDFRTCAVIMQPFWLGVVNNKFYG